MENKADKHMGRQDGLLLRAVSRVWKARERGRLLERVRNVRLVKDAWAVWGHRIQEQKDNTGLYCFCMLESSISTLFYSRCRECFLPAFRIEFATIDISDLAPGASHTPKRQFLCTAILFRAAAIQDIAEMANTPSRQAQDDQDG